MFVAFKASMRGFVYYVFLSKGEKVRTCSCASFQGNSAISHSNPLLLLIIGALAQVDVGHIFPAALGAGVHAECCVGELNAGLVGLDVPLLIGLVGDGLARGNTLAIM